MVNTCFSSQLTSQLMLFRNAHGPEDQWLIRDMENPPLWSRFHRILLAEVGSSALLVAGIIEFLASITLLLPAACALPCTKEPVSRLFKHIDSCIFTLAWNLDNAVFSNLYHVNISTQESFARLVHDNDNALHAAKLVMLMVSIIASISLGTRVTALFWKSLGVQNGVTFGNVHQAFVLDWMKAHRPVIANWLDRKLITFAELTTFLRTEKAITNDSGVGFLVDYMLKEGELDAETRDALLGSDPGVFHFIATRIFYLFAFGPLSDQPLPTFLEEKAQISITLLRSKYSKEAGESVKKQTSNYMEFQKDIEHEQQELYAALKKEALELTHSTFFIKYWSIALDSALPDQDVGLTLQEIVVG